MTNAMSPDIDAIAYMIRLIRDGAWYSITIGADRVVWINVAIEDNIDNAEEPLYHIVGIKETETP